MKHLKLFFALFAMLALGVGNAWAQTTISFGFANWDGVTANFSGTAKDEVTQTVDGVKVTYTRNGSSLYANTSAIRFYKSNTLKFDAPTGYSIQSIAFTCSSYQTDITSNVGTCTATSSNLSWSGDATSVTFTRPSGASGYATITGATVTLAATSGGSTPDPGTGEGGEDPETPGTGGSGTIVIKYNSTFAPALPTTKDEANATSTEHTVENLTIKEQGLYNNGSGYIMFVQGKGFLYNTQSLGTITSVSVTYTSGTSTSGKAGVYFGSTEQSTYTITSNQTIKGQSQTDTWTNTTEGNGFFQLSTSNKNVQITQIEITYTSGGSTETAPSLTPDQFSWSAAAATATLPNTFDNKPTLTNTENLEVTYSSSNGEVATIDENGNVTLKGVGTADIKATAGGEGTTFKETTVFYTLTVNKAPATPTDNVYVKVTSTEGITDGEYLIVYETGNVAFNGALETLDVASNTVEVTISDNVITGNTDIDKALFTIDATNGTVLSASGKYIGGKSSDENGINISATALANDLSIDQDGNAVIASNNKAIRYNKTAGQTRFRYFKSNGGTQEKIQLYKKASSHTVTIASCTNGSVSAKMGETALATNDQVLSGIQITLSNEAATGYKLAAYDVYKTGDATTKVTVTDGKFIMPEFDVTISATFELAKTLTGIEITTPATQTTFWQGETFNYEGLKVTAHFDGAADEDVTDKVTVEGSTATAGAAVEVTVSYNEGATTETATYNITVKAIPNTKETAYTVAEAYDIIDKLTTAEGVFIKGIVSKVDSYNETNKSITYWISDDGTTTKQLQAYSGKGLESADFVDINGVSVEDQVIVCGNLKKYNDTYEFGKDNYLVDHTKTTKADPELSYTTTEYNVNLGDAFEAPTLNNPHILAVTYSSNNEDVATVAADGAVTIKAAGTVVITASFAGNDDYVAGSASYTINITDPNVSEATFVAGTDKSDTKSISKNGITVEFTDGSFSRDDNYRCYVGQSMTISYADGNITKIVIECTANDEAQYGPGQFTTETATYSYSGKVGTWTGEANSVTFTAGTQVRMTTITVYYKQDTRTPAGIAWNPATVSLTVGDAFTAPTFNNPNELTGIEFTSSNTELATVNNAGVISLVSGKTGTATITARYADDATYKAAEVTCVINVNPVTDEVVILAQHAGKWYAMMAQCPTGLTERLAALPVEYINGTLYNVTEENKALITWTRAFVDDKVTFQNNGKYLKGKSTTTLILEEGETGLYLWDKDTYTMTINETVRTFLYKSDIFRNYDASQASNGIAEDKEYSSLPVVTAPVYATGDAYGRTVTEGEYGTICIPYGSSNYTGAEFYEISWMEMDGTTPKSIWLDEVNGALTAGKPYIFKATADEIAIVGDGTTAASPIAGEAGLTGTFALIQDSETSDDPSNTLEGNYLISGNQFLLCPAGCWLKENRAYIDATIIANHTTEKAEIPGRRRVCLGETSENEATGFENIVAPEGQAIKAIVNGQLIIIRDGVKYNVQGQKL